MNSAHRSFMALGAATLTLAGCGKISPISAPALRSGSADFSVVAAMGTSISTGYQSGGVVDNHQDKSFPDLFANHVGASSFTIPSISADGIPPLLQIVSLNPLVINNTGRPLGAPTNFAQPSAYHNMAIPGALLFDVADSSAYHTSPNPVGRTNFTYFTLIQRSRGTILEQVASRAPTFITFEYGANEALGYATSGGAIALFPSATFAALLTGTLNGLQALIPGAKVAMFNVPDVTSIPFFTTFPPYVLDASGNPVFVGGVPLTLIGHEGAGDAPLGPGDLVLLTAASALAAGDGFPIGQYSYLTGAPGTGVALENSKVLSAGEVTTVQTAISAYNAAIASEATTRGLALVDLNALLRQAATVGLEYRGSTYTSAFLTGGLFSLDGVHPNDFAHGILCNALIAAVNRQFGSNIAPLDLSTVATFSSSRARPSGGGPVLPWIRNEDEGLAQLFPWKKAPAL
ncbi:MAG: hypothetical protein HYR73_06695 [Candidatus Eisenbacteria bacterium]|nr:hypothetical protein [Candidatus Eisenbacteria bacterium]